MEHELNKEYSIALRHLDLNFDLACNTARQAILDRLGCDDCGHLCSVKDSERSLDYVEITFDTYSASIGMGGQTVTYTFKYKVVREEN